MQRNYALALGGLLLSAALGTLSAQPALPSLPPAAKEPKPEFALQPQHGPYLIYIASFRGRVAKDADMDSTLPRDKNAWELAHDLAQELRDSYKLPAFVLHRVDKDAEAERNRLLEIQSRGRDDGFVPPAKRVVVVQEEYAVMVGNYKDLESARTAIKKLKTMERPKSLGWSGLVMWRQRMDTPKPTDVKKLGEQATNPFNHAFATINPLMHQQRHQGTNFFQEMDWKEVNKREEFSLLACPQPYTLVVKEFRSKEMEKLRPAQGFNPKQWNPRPKLGTRDAFTFLPPVMDQADEALEFAKKLRDKRFQAYVLHLGGTSFVTVGGYTGLRDPALGQTWAALKSQYGKELPMLQNPLPTLMPVPDRNAPKLGDPIK